VQRLNGHGPPGPSHLFRLDIDEVSCVGMNEKGNNIVIHMWTEAGGEKEVRKD